MIAYSERIILFSDGPVDINIALLFLLEIIGGTGRGSWWARWLIATDNLPVWRGEEKKKKRILSENKRIREPNLKPNCLLTRCFPPKQYLKRSSHCLLWTWVCLCVFLQSLTICQRSLTTMQIQIQGLLRFTAPIFPTAQVKGRLTD